MPLSNVHSRISDKRIPNKAHAEDELPLALVLAWHGVTIGRLPGRWSVGFPMPAQSGNTSVRSEAVSRRPDDPTHRAPLLLNLIRAGFLLLVIVVLWGVVIVSRAHLTEQFLAVEKQSEALIDPDEGEDALTPENIEAQILALTLRFREEELLIPFGEDPRPRAFTINPGEPARYIAARLAAAGFVRDADLFNLYLRVEKLDRNIEAGNFMLAESMTIPEIARELQQARFEEVLVTIPEGFRAEEIAERLAANFVIDSERFLTAVRQPQGLALLDDYEFLKDLSPGDSLEGYLFPDTYRFPRQCKWSGACPRFHVGQFREQGRRRRSQRGQQRYKRS